jgi:ribosomal protein S18 acetylase RimI-like enzyme
MNDYPRYEVRRFDPVKDLDAAYRCYVSGFYHNSWPLIDHAESRLVKDMILNLTRTADVTFVAEVDGEARGVLVGYFPADKRSLLRAAALTLQFQLKVLFRRYRMTPFARAAWWRMGRGFLSFMIRQPRSPAEILMLNSQKEYRGGIGRAMMDAWVDETRARGYDSTIVNTDSTVSWDFYERYGFKRVREFPTKMFYYSLPGVDARGYIYSLDIPAVKND